MERVASTAPSRNSFETTQLIVLGAAVTFAAATVALLLLRSHPATTTATLQPGAPSLVTASQLKRLAESADHPLYWAGARSGFSYELTATPSGRVFVRYLPAGVAAGDPRASFLTVGTYPAARSFENLTRAAKQPGSRSAELGHAGLAVFAPKRSSSVYLAYPGADYQVEVYAPSLASARAAVLSGSIKPIG